VRFNLNKKKVVTSLSFEPRTYSIWF